MSEESNQSLTREEMLFNLTQDVAKQSFECTIGIMKEVLAQQKQQVIRAEFFTILISALSYTVFNTIGNMTCIDTNEEQFLHIVETFSQTLKDMRLNRLMHKEAHKHVQASKELH